MPRGLAGRRSCGASPEGKPPLPRRYLYIIAIPLYPSFPLPPFRHSRGNGNPSPNTPAYSRQSPERIPSRDASAFSPANLSPNHRPLASTPLIRHSRCPLFVIPAQAGIHPPIPRPTPINPRRGALRAMRQRSAPSPTSAPTIAPLHPPLLSVIPAQAGIHPPIPRPTRAIAGIGVPSGPRRRSARPTPAPSRLGIHLPRS